MFTLLSFPSRLSVHSSWLTVPKSENYAENTCVPPVYPTHKGPLTAFHLPLSVSNDDPTHSIVNNRASNAMAASPQYHSVGAFPGYDQFSGPQPQMNHAQMGWGDKFPEGPESAALSPPQTSLDPQSHMMQNMDTDMSTDSHMSDPRAASVSTHGTPSGSRNSSHTSYSPPQQYVPDKSDESGIRVPMNIQQGSVSGYLNPATSFGAFAVQPCPHSPLSQHHQQQQQHHHYRQQQQQRSLHHQQHNHPQHPSHSAIPQQQQAQPGEAFGMAPAWSIGPDVQSVGSLSPLGEGNWTQMLAGMGWDTGLATGGEISWRGGREG